MLDMIDALFNPLFFIGVKHNVLNFVLASKSLDGSVRVTAKNNVFGHLVSQHLLQSFGAGASCSRDAKGALLVTITGHHDAYLFVADSAFLGLATSVAGFASSDVTLPFLGVEEVGLIEFGDTIEVLDILSFQCRQDLMAPVEEGHIRDPADLLGSLAQRQPLVHAFEEL